MGYVTTAASSTELQAKPGAFLSVSMEGWWHNSRPLYIHKELSRPIARSSAPQVELLLMGPRQPALK